MFFFKLQIRNPKSRLVSQEQGETQRMDMESTDGRSKMAGGDAACATIAPTTGAGAPCVGMFHVHTRVLRRPLATGTVYAPRPD